MGDSVQDDFILSEFDKRQIINEYEDGKKIIKVKLYSINTIFP